MRLGQLARQLGINTSDIVTLLQENGIDINDHPNVKIEGEREEIVLKAYPPEVVEEPNISEEEKEVEPIQEINTQEPAPTLNETEVIESIPEDTTLPRNEMASEKTLTEVTEPEMDIEAVEPLEPMIDEEQKGDPTEAEEIEVIRAPKIELEGLKVVGKIDLPEPKIKEPEPKQEKVKKPANKKTQRAGKRELTEEEKEARRVRNRIAKERRLKKEKERIQREKEEQERLLKAEHYKQKLAADAKIKKAKKAKKKKEKLEAQREPQRPAPKTVIGKFWRWLNT